MSGSKHSREFATEWPEIAAERGIGILHYAQKAAVRHGMYYQCSPVPPKSYGLKHVNAEYRRVPQETSESALRPLWNRFETGSDDNSDLGFVEFLAQVLVLQR